MRIKTQRHAIYPVPELEALWTRHLRALTDVALTIHLTVEEQDDSDSNPMRVLQITHVDIPSGTEAALAPYTPMLEDYDAPDSALYDVCWQGVHDSAPIDSL